MVQTNKNSIKVAPPPKIILKKIYTLAESLGNKLVNKPKGIYAIVAIQLPHIPAMLL